MGVPDDDHYRVRQPGRNRDLHPGASVVLDTRHQVVVPHVAQGTEKKGWIAAEQVDLEVFNEPVLAVGGGVEHHPLDRQEAAQVDPDERVFDQFPDVRFLEGRGRIAVHDSQVELVFRSHVFGAEGGAPQGQDVEGDVAVRIQQDRRNPPFVEVEGPDRAAVTGGGLFP